MLKLYKILSALSRSPEQWVPLLKFFIGDNLKFLSFIYLFLIEGELQYYFGFCHTSTLISHRYTSVSSLMSLLPPPAPSHPSSYHRALVWVPWAKQQIPPAIYFTYTSVCVSSLLSSFVPPSPYNPHCHGVHESVLYVCSPIAALQIGSSVQLNTSLCFPVEPSCPLFAVVSQSTEVWEVSVLCGAKAVKVPTSLLGPSPEHPMMEKGCQAEPRTNFLSEPAMTGTKHWLQMVGI